MKYFSTTFILALLICCTIKSSNLNKTSQVENGIYLQKIDSSSIAIKSTIERKKIVNEDEQIQTSLNNIFRYVLVEEMASWLKTIDNAEQYFNYPLIEILLNSNKKKLSKVHHKLALIYNSEFNYEMAAKYFNSAIDNDKNNINYVISYADFLAYHRRYNESAKTYENAIVLSNDMNYIKCRTGLYKKLSFTMYSLREYDKAIEFYEKSFQIRLKEFDWNHSFTKNSRNL